MSLIQILSASGSILFLGMILAAVYKGKLQEAYALIWIISGVFILAVSLSSEFLNLLARCVGIQTPGFAILLFLTFGVLLLLFQQTLVVSKMQERVSRLAEELALLKNESKQPRPENAVCQDSPAEGRNTKLSH